MGDVTLSDADRSFLRQAVDLARRVVSAGPVAFVNAVLRKLAAKDLATWVAELKPTDDRLAALAFEHSHPRWIASAFRDALGGDLWQTGAALAAELGDGGVALGAGEHGQHGEGERGAQGVADPLGVARVGDLGEQL